jgi:uncharacterized protein (TIGR04222 family)
MPLVLAVVLGLLPGLAAVLWWRGPTIEGETAADRSKISIAEVAVLRDGAVGATRWAFAALACRLAREGHCTLGRTRQRRWVGPAPVATVELHADPTVLSSLEQTVLRQLGRHDTLDGFGFAGSTFRRRTLRDVRADLVTRGWLADRARRSTVCLLLGAAVLATSGVGLAGGLPLLWGAGGLGFGLGGLLAASVRYPVTEAGAQLRAAHRAHAERQRARIEARLSDAPQHAMALLIEALPSLVLERVATPRWLRAVAGAVEGEETIRLNWVRDEVGTSSSCADDLQALAAILRALGAGPWWTNLW